MSDRAGRRPRWPGAVLLLVAAALVPVTIWLSTRARDPELDEAARVGRGKLVQAVAALAHGRETKAAAAARTPQLVAGLASGYDAATFQDAFDTEPWWSSVRAEWPVTALVLGRQTLAMVGPRAPAPLDGARVSAAPVIARARADGQASGMLVHGRDTYLASAAVVPGADRGGEPAVLVIAERLDEKLLTQLAAPVSGAAGVSDGRTLLAAVGSDQQRSRLAGLVGQEGAVPAVLNRGTLAAALPLDTNGPWLVTVYPAPTTLIRLLRTGLGGASVVLALLGAWLLVSRGRHRRSEPAPPMDPDELRAQLRSLPSRPTLPRGQPRTPPPDRGEGGGRAWAGTAAAVAPNSGGGLTLGRYNLLEQVGEGGMAEIHMAAMFGPEGFKRHLVVKRLHPHLARRKDVVSQFIDEARLQARLAHPNIVPVFDFGRAGDEYYLALEYVHGRDLDKIVQKHMLMRQRGLPLPVTAFVMHDVLEALQYAHNKTDEHDRPLEIVHRDVSPANVLVSYQGEVKLSDFGIVKAERRVSRTEVGLVKGNVSYMSPEQARGVDVDHRSDLFSAAVVMFHCLTGQALYKGETTLNQLVRAAVGPATSQFDQIGALPPEVAPILARALMLDPTGRYQSAAEFARELRPLIRGGRAELVDLLAELFPPDLRKDRS